MEKEYHIYPSLSGTLENARKLRHAWLSYILKYITSLENWADLTRKLVEIPRKRGITAQSK
jgi:hypothetical protein